MSKVTRLRSVRASFSGQVQRDLGQDGFTPAWCVMPMDRGIRLFRKPAEVLRRTSCTACLASRLKAFRAKATKSCPRSPRTCRARNSRGKKFDEAAQSWANTEYFDIMLLPLAAHRGPGPADSQQMARDGILESAIAGHAHRPPRARIGAWIAGSASKSPPNKWLDRRHDPHEPQRQKAWTPRTTAPAA